VGDFKSESLFPLKRPFLFLFFLAAAIFPFVLLSLYIHPVADDFDAALRGGNIFLKNQINYYLNWNGRYAANPYVFFTSLHVGNIILYKLYPVILISLLIVSLYFFLHNIFGEGMKKIEKITLASLVVFLFLNVLPHQPEALYWFTGSVTYVFPFILFLIYITLLVRYFKKAFLLNRKTHAALMIFLLFYLCGFNEVMTVMLLMGHLLFSIVWIMNKAEKRSVVLVLLLVALCGMIIMVTAPGNAVRGSNFPLRHQFSHSVIYSMLQTIRFSGTWILSPAVLLATLFYMPITKKLKLPESFRIHPIISTLALFGIIFCCVFPAYWSTGILGQHRTVNAACFTFILFWFFNLHILAKYIPARLYSFLDNKRTASVLSSFLILSIFLTGNSLTSWSDLLTVRAKEFNRELNEREAMLNDCKQKGIADCKVPALKAKPKSIFVLDIQSDSSHWINNDYAIYYELNSVSLQK
jgi:hypothetical protein